MANMGDMFKQAQKMQKQMGRVQEELKERVVEGTAGGGIVKAMINGQQEILSVKIAPEAVDPDDVEMLEDLVLSALNQAMKKSREMSEQAMGKLTGGMNMPGLF